MIEDRHGYRPIHEGLALLGMPDCCHPCRLGPAKVKFAYLTEVSIPCSTP